MAIELLKRKLSQVRQPRLPEFRTTEGEAEADALFLSIGDGAVVIDSNGRVSRVNQKALEILGFKRARDLIGKWWPGTIIAHDRNGNILTNINRPITQVFLTGDNVTARIYYKRKDGSSVPVSLNVAPVLLHGKPIGAIEVFRDITNELAEEQAKDDFISIASHQLRTPATSVKQYTAMLLEGYAEKLKPRQRELLARAYESNERQLAIIEDLLNVARVDAGNIGLNVRRTDLIKLLQSVIEDQASKVRRRQQKLSFSHPQAKLYCNIDEARIRMVMDNILDNAIKYTPEGRPISVRAYALKDQAVVKVRDRGVGLAEKDLAKLFHKFERIPNPLSVESGGTGLGLYWVEKIVKLHQGRITVTSQLG